MRYRGGKAKIAKRIIDALDKKYEYTRWVEPFAGMASLSRYTKAQDIYLNDLDINIYTFLKELYAQGWQDLPDFVSEAEFKAAVNLEPSLLKTFIKFGCSFGGSGVSYAKSKPRNGKPYNYARESKNSCVRLYEAWGDKNVTFSNKSYTALEYRKTDLIYCDPPYKNTRGFNVGEFDSGEFFNWMRLMHKEGYRVICSEYSENLPDDASVIWEKSITQNLGHRKTKTEIVFSF